jgi:hypothetical protein
MKKIIKLRIIEKNTENMFLAFKRMLTNKSIQYSVWTMHKVEYYNIF